jgi:recombination protein RecA
MVKKTNKKKVSKKVSTLDLAKKAIEKKYGDVVKPMSQKPLIIDTISTRSIGLDMNLGRGGIALGRIYEIYGGEASGKTTLAMSLIAEAQSRGMTAAFIDT